MTKYELKVDGKSVYSFESDQTPVIEAVQTEPEIGAIYSYIKGSDNQVRVIGYNYRGEVMVVESSKISETTAPYFHAVDRLDFSRNYKYVRSAVNRRFKVTRLTP